MNEIEQYQELVELASKQRDEKSRLKGSIDVIVRNLKDMGYSNLSQADVDLKKKKTLLQKKKTDLAERMKTFKEKYGKHL